MRSIAIVADSNIKKNRPSNVGEIIKENIHEVLEDKVIINNYYIDNLTENDHINEDIVLIMARSRAIQIKNHTKSTDNIIVAKRTFMKEAISQLSNIPENSDVLVVNDNIETVLETVSTLYNIGIKHINLIPFEKGKEYSHIKYAISPSELEFIPEYIHKIYDVKNRVLDISTMLLIINRLKINNKKIQQNLYNYYQKIFTTNDAITKNHNNLLRRTEELDYLLDISHDGILLTNEKGKIIIANKKFKSIFEISTSIEGRFLDSIIPSVNIKKYYKKHSVDELITYKKKYINLEKKEIIHFNNEKRMYFNFQEVTYIKKLEQNLSHKLRQKGHIARYSFDDLVSQSKEMSKIISMSKKIAKTDLTVLITGESGTGKEVLAQAIHNASSRKNQPFIAINGAAIPENLLESELFGYSSGSFTGASKKGKKGLFEKANNGTIFLDEIGDMPNHLQSKLLRVLQEQQIAPIGSDSIIDVDVRIIAATHKDPMEMIKTGKFRKDLFYRLNVFSLNLPPLRERPEDIKILLDHFTNKKFTCNAKCLNFLLNYDWPGNIRELNNISQYLLTLQENSNLSISSLPNYLVSELNKTESFKKNINNYTNDTIINEKLDRDDTIEVLRAILFLNNINKTAGRKHLFEFLENKNIKITTHNLRKILSTLNEINLINTKKGRNGSYITDTGKDYLKNNC